MRLSYLITLTILLYCSSSKAQYDTEFWFAAPELSQNLPSGSNDRPVYLNISGSNSPSIVTISQPAGSGGGYIPTQSVIVAAHSMQRIDLTNWIDNLECKPANTVLNYGLHLTATSPVIVYYEIASQLAPEFFILKGRNALGKFFYVPGQNIIDNAAWYNPPARNSFDIVVTEDNTTVSITPAQNITGYAAGTTFTIVMNRGQVYSATATSPLPGEHLNGSVITSDKDIAVTVKDDELWSNTMWNGSCQDSDGDQIIPVSLLGREYIAVKGLLNGPGTGLGDQLFITATQNGTTITQNGTPVAGVTLNAGQTHRLPVSVGGAASTYITTSEPAYIWHMSGSGCEIGSTILPAIDECSGSSSVTFARSTNEPLFINLLVQAGGENNFFVNGLGTIVTAGQFSPVPGTSGSWLSAQVQLSPQAYPQGNVITVRNSSHIFHLGVLNGEPTGTGTRFGYFSDYSPVSVTARTKNSTVCENDTLYLTADTINGAVYNWTGPNGFSSNAQNPVIPHFTGSDAGPYVVIANTPCGQRTDTIHISLITLPKDFLGPDIDTCADSIVLRTNIQIPGISISYLWDNGVITDTLNIINSRQYSLQISAGSCISNDTINVTLRQIPRVDLGVDTTVCTIDLPIELQSLQAAGSTFLWNDGSTGNQISVSTGGDYWLEVTNDNCTARDTVNISVTIPPDLDFGPDTTLCNYDLPLLLDGTSAPGSSYLWSDGTTNPTLQVTTTGEYALQVTMGGCIVNDTVHVTVNQAPTVNLGPDMAICLSETPLILTSVQPAGSDYLWSNGTTQPDISLTSDGKYWLTVTNNGCQGSDTMLVRVTADPQINAGTDTTICQQHPLIIGDSVPEAIYTWNTGSSSSHIEVSATGQYILTVNLHGCLAGDTVNIIAMPPPEADLGNDQHICSGDTIIISAGNTPGNTYLWNTGAKSERITVTEAGIYTVTVTSEYSCTSSDTLSVLALHMPEVRLGEDTTLCMGNALLLYPYSAHVDSLIWSDGSRSSEITVTASSIYTVTGYNSCGTDSDEINVAIIFCDIMVPNAFTPNKDGLNDIFRVLGTLEMADDFSMSIYNRWGQCVYTSNDKYAGWDGMYKGSASPSGTYAYMVHFRINQEKQLLKGNFHLIR